MWKVSAPSGTGVKERFFPFLLGAALCFLSSPPAFAQCTPDAYEEDDACIASKTVIHGGDTQSYNFCQDAEDFLSFNACTGRTYTIETSNLGTSADTVLELYDTDCASLLTSDNDGGVGLASKIAGWTAPADGTYHIKVRQFDGTFGDNRGYDVALTGDTSPCSTWAQIYDRVDEDAIWSIRQTFDGGCVAAGYTITSSPSALMAWVLKFDAGGNVQWQKTYGGGDFSQSRAYCIRQTSEGGFIVAGDTNAFGAAGYDFWVLKLDENGNVDPPGWQKTYGGGSNDWAESIEQTSEGGYIVAGWTESFGAGSRDFWVLKLDASGNVTWQKTYGSTNAEWAESIQQTTDGKFIVAGIKASGGTGDFWMLKLDASGGVQWQKTYGYPGMDDEAHSIQQTTDGGFIVAGGAMGNSAFGVLKLDASGDVEWEQAYRRSGDERAYAIEQTADGGFVVAGYTGDLFNPDAWILKLDGLGNIEWQRSYGGSSSEYAFSVQQAYDGGFFVGGLTESFGVAFQGAWVLKLDAYGRIDPSCTFISDTFARGVDLPESTVDSTAISDSPLYTSTTTSIAGLGATATIVEQCAGGGPYLEYDSLSLTDCGNLDGVVDPGETVTLDVTVQNVGINNAFTVSGVLSTVTPGVTIPLSSASFPDVPVNLTGASLTPFQFVVDLAVPCGTVIDFMLDLSYENGIGDLFFNSISFQVTVGNSVLMFEDFNAGLPGTWTVVDGGSGPETWTDSDPCNRYLFPDTHMICDSWCPFLTALDERLITPLIDCSATSVVTLQFAHSFSYGGFGFTTAYVEVRSTNTGGAWTTKDTYTGSDAEGTVILDITSEAANAPDVQVSWYYVSASDDAIWGVDNVVVEGTPVCNPASCPPLYLLYNSHSFSDCGNADGAVDPGETIDLNATVQNIASQGAFSVSGVLSTTTPGITVTANTAAFPDMPAGLTGTSLTPFQFTVDASVPCGTVIDFTLDLTYEDSTGNPFSNSTPFQEQVKNTATVTLFSEDFNAGLPGTWTVVDGGDSTDTWTDVDVCNQNLFADTYMICDSSCPSFTVREEQLITPSIDCSALSGLTAVTLRFDHSYSYGMLGGPSTANVKVWSTKTGGWITKATYTGSDAEGTVILDITDEAAGESDVQVNWHYDSVFFSDALWGVDNVVVEGAVCNSATCPTPPSEPSPPGALEPLIIPSTAANQIVVENVADETGYVVYEGAIGTWYGTPSQTCLDTWNDLGSTVQLGYSMAPGDRWVVVSAANAVGESSCGTDSDTTERNTAPGWPAPGPCP